VGQSEHLRGAMPPFPGTAVEQRALARYLAGHLDANQAMIHGEEVWHKRCGVCHTRDGYRPLEETLSGLSDEELVELLAELDGLDERMPPWTGSERDTQLLVRHIQSWFAESEGDQ